MRVAPDGQIQAWHSGIASARTIATDGRRVLLVGGYGPDRNRCVVGRLGDTVIEDLQELTLVVPDGRPLEGADMMSRGPLLHVFAVPVWYQLDIRDLPYVVEEAGEPSRISCLDERTVSSPYELALPLGRT